MIISYERARAEALGLDARGGLMERAERFVFLSIGLAFGILVPVLWVMLVLTAFTAADRFRARLPAGRPAAAAAHDHPAARRRERRRDERRRTNGASTEPKPALEQWWAARRVDGSASRRHRAPAPQPASVARPSRARANHCADVSRREQGRTGDPARGRSTPLAHVGGRVARVAMKDRREHGGRHQRRGERVGAAGRRRRARSIRTARYWFEMLRLPAEVRRGEIAAHFTIDGYERILGGLDAGNGVILALPHLGGWE